MSLTIPTNDLEKKLNALFQVSNLISTSNHMLWRTIWDKMPECMFENVKNHEGDLS